MKLNILLNELMDLLDNNPDIKKINELKNNIDNDTLELINEYRINPSVSNKKRLFNNSFYIEYIKSESNLNYLIMEINNKLKRGHDCENN